MNTLTVRTARAGLMKGIDKHSKYPDVIKRCAKEVIDVHMHALSITLGNLDLACHLGNEYGIETTAQFKKSKKK